MNNNVIPKKLNKEPLIEAVCELRFKSDNESISDLLPGLIFQQLGNRFPKTSKLPASELPRVILTTDPNFRYTPTVKLSGDIFSILIGERVISVCCARPYAGWDKFSSMTIELLAILNETSLITQPERISLKYIDILLSQDGFTLDDLCLELQIGGNRIIREPVHLRTEIHYEGFLNIIQIGSPAKAVIDNKQSFDGIMIDIDTVSISMPADFWLDPKEILNRAHSISKAAFFDLLKTETIERLEPEY